MPHRAASAAYAALFEALLTGPCTVSEMVAETGMHENTVRKFLAAMYRRRCMRTVAMDPGRDGRLRVKVHDICLPRGRTNLRD